LQEIGCGWQLGVVKFKTRMHIMMQVINRDLSIAVLRYFVKQRQQEIAEGILKAPRKRKPPAEAAQLKEAAGAGVLAILFRRLKGHALCCCSGSDGKRHVMTALHGCCGEGLESSLPSFSYGAHVGPVNAGDRVQF